MSIARNTVYNFLGRATPLLLALLTVPLYLRYIGEDRYGVLSIVWLFAGYFSVLELGLSRASAYHLSIQHKDSIKDKSTTLWTALTINLFLGTIGAGILYVSARWAFTVFFHMQAHLRADVLHNLVWIAVSLPLSTFSAVLYGALESRELFSYMNWIGALTSAATQLLPLSVAIWVSPSLNDLIPTVVLARAVGVLLLGWYVWNLLPLCLCKPLDWKKAKDLLSYGGWISVSSLISPLLSTLDRMWIGAVLGVKYVTYYTVPSNISQGASIIPGSLVSSMFPVWSKMTEQDSMSLAERSTRVLIEVFTPIIITGIVILHIFLRYWISPEFANHSALVGMIILMGVWINGLAYVPYNLLQARGRPDIPAKLHVIELPFFLIALWLGLHYFGLWGAAVAWSARVAADALLLYYVAKIKKHISVWGPATLGVCVSFFLAPTTIYSEKTICAVLFLAAYWAWSFKNSQELQKIWSGILLKLK